MRSLRLIALCLVVPLALAQSPTPPVTVAPPVTAQPAVATQTPADQPRSTIPSDSNCRSRPVNCQNARDRVAAAKGHPVDILFVGDSITEAWTSTGWGGVNRGAAVWDKMYAPRNALNFGVGADRTQHVLWRLDNMDVQDLKPRVTVLLIGTNNNIDTAPDIAAGVHSVIAKLEAMYPATKIILVSILPNARATSLMTDANALIRTFADDHTVFYLDLVALMPPAGDNWVGLGPDKLHPTDAGYQIWADAMEPLLTRLLGSPPPAPPTAPQP
jgi:lysophospholipase L1-like esterase